MAGPDNSAESLRAAAEAQERNRRAREESDRLFRERMAEDEAYRQRQREANERPRAQTHARSKPSPRASTTPNKGSPGLLPVVGLVVVVIALINMSRGADRQDDPSPPTPALASSTPSAATTSPAPQPAAPVQSRPYVGFAGDWSADKAFQLVWPNGRYDPAIHGGPAAGGRIDSPVARIERTFQARYFGEDATVLLTSLSEGACPTCSFELSIFVFAPRSAGWELIAWKRNFGRIWSRASQGLLLVDNLKSWALSGGETGLIVPSHETRDGYFFEWIDAYAFTEKGFSRLFHLSTSQARAASGEPPIASAELMRITHDSLYVKVASNEFSGVRQIRLPLTGSPMYNVHDLARCVGRFPEGADIAYSQCAGA